MHAAVLTDTGVVVDVYIEHRVDHAGRDLCHRHTHARSPHHNDGGGGYNPLATHTLHGGLDGHKRHNHASTSMLSSHSLDGDQDASLTAILAKSLSQLYTAKQQQQAQQAQQQGHERRSSSNHTARYNADDDVPLYADDAGGSGASPVVARAYDSDGVSSSRDDDSSSSGCYYVCRATQRPLPQRIFHESNVLPFGLRTPSELFATPGRHTSRGLVLGVDAHGRYLVVPYTTTTTTAAAGPLRVKAAVRPWRGKTATATAATTLEALLPTYHVADVDEVRRLARTSASAAVLRDMRAFFARSRRVASRAQRAHARAAGTVASRSNKHKSKPHGAYDDDDDDDDDDDMAGVQVCALHELQLPPALAIHAPMPPLRVGAYVLARRYGCASTLHLARVAAVHYDVSYTLHYLSDGGVDVAVLHNDVHLLTTQAAAATTTITTTTSSSSGGDAARARMHDHSNHYYYYGDATTSSSSDSLYRSEGNDMVDYRDCLVPQYGDKDDADDGGSSSSSSTHGGKAAQQQQLSSAAAAPSHRRHVHAREDVAEVCTVRDRVLVALHKQLPARVIEALGQAHYRVVLDSDAQHDVHVTGAQILHVQPVLRDAVYADPRLVDAFVTLDARGSGVVRWKDVRHVLLHMQTYGNAIRFQRIAELYRDLRIRTGAVHAQLLRKVPMQDDEVLLRFAEFEYVMLRAHNLL